MKVARQLLDFYVNSSIHVALAVYAFTWLTLLQFQVAYDENVLYFVFYSTIVGYNFVKYFGVAKFHYRGLTKRIRAIQIMSLLSAFGALFYAMHLHESTIIYIGLFALITFLYAIPFLPKHIFIDSEYNLRAVGGLKIYLIALVWSGVTVILPVINNDIVFDFEVLIIAVQRFIYVIVLMLPFEIRDLQFDGLKLSTIPQKIGVKQTKILGVLLLALMLLLDCFKEPITYADISVLFFVTLFMLLLVVFSRMNQGKYYAAFWVEALPVFWLLLYLIFK